MYYFYVDESGTRSLEPHDLCPGAPLHQQHWLYVLTAVSLFEHRWHKFEKFLRRRKRELGEIIFRESAIRLGLRDYEIKSTWIRNSRRRQDHPLLRNLNEQQLTALADAFYKQLQYHNMNVFSVVVDKRHLRDYMDPAKLQRKAWELLLERVENFMRMRHGKHQALIVADDTTRQENLALAEKLVYFQEHGTSSGCWLKHISGLPMFTRSELSNGIQLADLCSYNIYRAFRDQNLEYPYFRRIEGSIWRDAGSRGRTVDGLKVFPDDSPLVALKEEWQKKTPVVTPPGLS